MGSDRTNSFDCSGLVGYCLTGGYGRVGTTYTFMGWPRVSDPQPGDVCTNWDHCGIYIGNGMMIHAPQPGENVKIGRYRQEWFMFVARRTNQSVSYDKMYKIK